MTNFAQPSTRNRFNYVIQNFLTSPYLTVSFVLLKLKPEQIRLGNKLLVYISCCLAGRAYPYGDIPKEKVI